MMEIRNLRADEVEVRVSTINENGCSLLLYKDARCDMNILDETFGVMNWQRKHELINGNLFCSVGIRNPETGEWIWKQDVGVESYTEKEKGEASDSFKRACFNWGIGRELYTAPSIWVNASSIDLRKNDKGKFQTYSKFRVSEMTVENKRIVSLEIVAKSRGRDWETVYSMHNKKPVQRSTEQNTATERSTELNTAAARMDIISSLYNMDRKIAQLQGTADGEMVEYCLNHKNLNKQAGECTAEELKSLMPIMVQLLERAEQGKRNG